MCMDPLHIRKFVYRHTRSDLFAKVNESLTAHFPPEFESDLHAKKTASIVHLRNRIQIAAIARVTGSA